MDGTLKNYREDIEILLGKTGEKIYIKILLKGNIIFAHYLKDFDEATTLRSSLTVLINRLLDNR